MFIDTIARNRSQTFSASDDENIRTALPWDAYTAIAAPGTARTHGGLQAHPIDRRKTDRISHRAMGNTYCSHLPDSQRFFTRR